MAEINNPHDEGENAVQFFSDAVDIVVREEDTKPATISESYRKLLEKKYGRKDAPPNGAAEGPTGS
jgi:hypothetical protein